MITYRTESVHFSGLRTSATKSAWLREGRIGADAKEHMRE